MRNILFIYRLYDSLVRKTINDSIFCFKNAKDKIYLYNYIYRIPTWKLLSRYKFDVIIYHYTFMTYRTSDIWQEIYSNLKDIKSGTQAVIVQDEYVYSKQINEFLIEMNINTVFTLAKGNAIKMLYPNVKADFYTVLPGYVDEKSIKKIKKLEYQLNKEKNTIDIGYRARKLNYSLGRQGYIKTEIAEKFSKILDGSSEIKTDIKTTGDEKNVFFGLDWYKFLIKCRTMLGCLGGASLLDADASLYTVVSEYMKKNPKATFDEVQKKFLKNDGVLDYSTYSPRFFECAMTKTCQVLVEGDYGDIMIPGIHFIEIKRDYSNIDEVILKIKNKKYCERISENAYRDLIQSGIYTYDKYVQYVLEHIPFVKLCDNDYLFVRWVLFVNNIIIRLRISIKKLLKNK